MQRIKRIEIDVDAKVFKVNNKDFSDVSKFSLVFENGLFCLNVMERFYASGKKMRPKDKDANDMSVKRL